MLAETVFDAAGVPLNFASGPASGPPLVLLHGVTRRWQDYVPLLPAVLPRWQVHALDFRGHGRSGRRPGHYHVVDYVGDVLTFVRGQLREPAVLYGHSLGALVAAAVAGLAPEAVCGVVLEDPPSAGLIHRIRQTSFHTFFAGMQQLAGSGLTVAQRAREMAEMRLQSGLDQPPVRLGDLRDATSLRFSARCLEDLDPHVLTPLLEEHWLEGYDQNAVMAAVRCPALLLRADERCGGMFPRRDAEHLVSLMADCTRIDFPGTGHAVHWLDLEKTVRFVVGFLESIL